MRDNRCVDPVESLVLLESAEVRPGRARRLVVLDLPGLAQAAQPLADEVVAWNDVSEEVAPTEPDDPFAELAEALTGADLVWMLLPKSLGALDEYCGLVARHASPQVQVLAAGREKHLNRSMNEVLEAHFEQVRASLGRNKSRVLHASAPRPQEAPGWPRHAHHEGIGLDLWAHGNTFAGTKPDPGTRLLLDQLPALCEGLPSGLRVLDLGCGNGTIVTTLGRLRPDWTLLATDNSRAAVAATRLTSAANGVEAGALLADGLSGWPDATLDLVVTNPPFHVGHAKDSSAALGFFDELARVLRPGGQVWCVFNSHLPWLGTLRRQVGTSEVIAQNPKFTVTRSTTY